MKDKKVDVETRMNNFRISILKTGIKEAEIARRSGLYRTSLIHFFSGGGISLKSALKISHALGIDI